VARAGFAEEKDPSATAHGSGIDPAAIVTKGIENSFESIWTGGETDRGGTSPLHLNAMRHRSTISLCQQAWTAVVLCRCRRSFGVGIELLPLHVRARMKDTLADAGIIDYLRVTFPRG
jgi:hypothetical protein